jgi:hypothetical protein
MNQSIVCTPKRLPPEKLIEAAKTATRLNPVNHPPLERLVGSLRDFAPTPERIALLTSKYWGRAGVRLTVAFLDNPPSDLRARILMHMNAWANSANVEFVETGHDGQVRIARANDGYWSYLGTDILHIPPDQQTMNLQGFSMNTPDSEFYRVVRHETGHTLGFPHEHMRRELVELIDPQAAINYFGQTQGWSPEEVRAQVLTPLEESSLLGTTHADQRSIMCYQIPGDLTRTGEPILGGTDIDPSDYEFAAQVYPPATAGHNGPRRRHRHAHAAGVLSNGHEGSAPLLVFGPGADPTYVASVVNALTDS